MAFSPEVAESLLVACHRHCCLCHKQAGSRMHVHHIVPRSEGGDDSEDNGIPLCLDCHAEVHSYDPKMAMGRKIRPSELRRHKEQWFAIVARPPWYQEPVTLNTNVATQDESTAELLPKIESGELWRPEVAREFLPRVLRLNDVQRDRLIQALSQILSSQRANEETRWNAALVVEFLVQWDPLKVPPEILLTMSNDPFFSVRSSSAVSYYHLAGFSPASVPMEVVGRLAAAHEDWYVNTPATSALVRLARTRAVAVEVLARGISNEDNYVRDHAADALGRVANVAPAAIREDIADQMIATGYPHLVEVGISWKRAIEDRRAKGEALDAHMF